MKKLLSLLVSSVLLCALAVPCVSAETNTALLSYLGGDVNGDWAVTSSDVRVLFAAVSGKAEKGSPAADADNDGAVNVLDALYAMRVTVDLADALLISPPAQTTTTLPEGETLAFTESYNQSFQNAGYTYFGTRVQIVQSAEELAAFYAANIQYTPSYHTVYDGTYFETGALALVKIDMSEWPEGVSVSDVVCTENTLTVQVRRVFLPNQSQPMLYHARLLVELSKDDLQGVDAVQVYVKDVDTNGDDRVWG